MTVEAGPQSYCISGIIQTTNHLRTAENSPISARTYHQALSQVAANLPERHLTKPALCDHAFAKRQKIATRHNRKSLRDAAIHVVEDCAPQHDDKGLSGMESRTKVGLENILSTPVKDLSLRILRPGETNAQSTLPKRILDTYSCKTPDQKHINFSFADPLPQSKPPKRPYSHGKRGQLDITDFEVNAATNNGKKFAFQETVREKKARKCLPACAKKCCKDLPRFADAAGLPQAPEGPKWRSSPGDVCKDERVNLQEQLLERYGRHRDAFPRCQSPPGFWNTDFPTTQEHRAQNEQAEQIRLTRIEKRKREAEKGSGGRYLYKTANRM